MITLDASTGRLTVDVNPSEFNQRPAETLNPNQNLLGFGRDLFGLFKAGCMTAEQGGASFSGNITWLKTYGFHLNYNAWLAFMVKFPFAPDYLILNHYVGILSHN